MGNSGYVIRACGLLILTISTLASCSGSGLTDSTVPPRSSNGNTHTSVGEHRPFDFTQKLIVANSAQAIYGSNGTPSILGFGLPSSGGHIAPDQDTNGPTTQLANAPSYVAVGPSGNIFTHNYNGQDIYRFTKNQSGNTSPNLTLHTAGWYPMGMAVDSTGNLWVAATAAGSGSNAVLEYASGAHGNATPVNTIKGSNTGLAQDAPWALALDQADDIYVSVPVGGSPRILIWAPGSSGNVAPAAKISGTKTQLDFPYQIAVDNSTTGNGRILVADLYGGSVLVFSPGAFGNATPTADITTVAGPAGVATDSAGNIFVAWMIHNEIDEFSPTANGNAVPTLVISGNKTGFYSPQGLAVSSF